MQQVYNITIGSIEVAPKTADVVSFFNSGCLQFARIRCTYELEVCYNGLVAKAKEIGKINDLLTAYKDYIKAISGTMDEKELAATLDSAKKDLNKIVKK